MPRHALFRRARRRAARPASTPTWRRRRWPTGTPRASSATSRSARSCSNYKKAIEAGLLKILSKMGISVISSYRGGYNFEALGLSRALVADYFPGMTSRISGIGLAGLERKVDGPAREGLERGGRRAAGRRLLSRARERRCARALGRADPPAAARLRHQLVRGLPQIFEAGERAEEDRCSCATCSTSGRSRKPASLARRPVGQRDPQALRHARHVARRAGARSARHAQHRHEPHRREVRLAAKAAKCASATSRCPMATTPTRRSSRSRRAASASPPSISTTAGSSRSRSRRAPSPAKAASCPASRSPSSSRATATRRPA